MSSFTKNLFLKVNSGLKLLDDPPIPVTDCYLYVGKPDK